MTRQASRVWVRVEAELRRQLDELESRHSAALREEAAVRAELRGMKSRAERAYARLWGERYQHGVAPSANKTDLDAVLIRELCKRLHQTDQTFKQRCNDNVLK